MRDIISFGCSLTAALWVQQLFTTMMYAGVVFLMDARVCPARLLFCANRSEAWRYIP